MVIRSAFKDYYDFVANRYGGGDPKIVYVRKRIKEKYDPQTGGYRLAVSMHDWPFHTPEQIASWYSDQQQIDVAYLVVAGRPYSLSREHNRLQRDLDGYTITDLSSMDKNRPLWRRRVDWSFIGRESPVLVELSRKVGAPVFVVEEVSYPWRKEGVIVCVCELCPILERMGMARLVAPEQMYQELAYFMGNTMKPVPDTDPPVAVSNREKILKAGFDLKQSFRHRT